MLCCLYQRFNYIKHTILTLFYSAIHVCFRFFLFLYYFTIITIVDWVAWELFSFRCGEPNRYFDVKCVCVFIFNLLFAGYKMNWLQSQRCSEVIEENAPSFVLSNSAVFSCTSWFLYFYYHICAPFAFSLPLLLFFFSSLYLHFTFFFSDFLLFVSFFSCGMWNAVKYCHHQPSLLNNMRSKH